MCTIAIFMSNDFVPLGAQVMNDWSEAIRVFHDFEWGVRASDSIESAPRSLPTKIIEATRMHPRIIMPDVLSTS